MQRKLRIVKRVPLPAIGICECCNAQFKSSILYPEAEIRAQFDAHECKPLENGHRNAGESTEGK
jgi:hypothetical protein